MFFNFGIDQRGFFCLSHGWSSSEGDFVWAVGHSSVIILPGLPASPHGLTLVFSGFTHVGPDISQNLTFFLNDTLIGEHDFINEALFSLPIPTNVAARFGKNKLEIRAEHAISPASRNGSVDQRELTFGLRFLNFVPLLRSADEIEPPFDSISDKELLLSFESLGDDCEFGFLQKNNAVNTPSLLRFGGMRLHRLQEALESDFDGIDSINELHVFGNDPGEYMIMQNRYRYAYHTFVYTWDMSRESVQEREAKRMLYCKRKLLDDLADGEKIFVVKSSNDLRSSPGDVLEVAKALRRHGNGTLLWVLPEDQISPCGTLRWHADNLLEARIDQLGVKGHVQHYSPYWIPLCRRVYRAVQHQRAI